MPHRTTEPGGRLDLRGPLQLGLLTLAALALRLFRLDRLPLWHDEAATWWYARLITGGGILEAVPLEPTPPLYYSLVAAMRGSFGDSDWMLRFPSAVFGALSIPVVFLLVRQLALGLGDGVARRAGWLAAILLTVHPLHVFYSREARAYPLLLLLTMALWLLLLRALEDDRDGSWTVVAAVLVVIAYSHYYALFLFAAAGLIVLFLARDRRVRLRGLVAVAVAGLLFLPYVVYTLPHLQRSGAAWSVEELYVRFPEDRSFGRVLEMGMIGADYPVYLRDISVPPTPSWLRWTTIAVQALFLVFAVGQLVRRGSRARRDLAFWLVAWLVPLLLPWATTHGVRAIFHPGRHDFYSLWGLVFAASVALSAVSASPEIPRKRRLAMVTVAFGWLLFAAGWRLEALLSRQPSDALRQRVAWIASQVAEETPADAADESSVRIWALGAERLLTERYLRLERPDLDELPISSFPADIDRHPGWSDAQSQMDDQEAIWAEARRRVAALGPEVRRVLVLPAGPPPRSDGAMTAQTWIDEALMHTLARAGWRFDPQRSRGDREVVTFVRAPPHS